MRLNTTLMLTALAAMPVVSAAPEDVAQTYVRLTKPAAAGKATAVLRAAVMPGLSRVPADVECCLVTSSMKLGDFFVTPLTGPKQAEGAPAAAEEDAFMAAPAAGPFDDEAFAKDITSYAIAAGKGTAVALRTMLPVMHYLSSNVESEQMAEEWAAEANAEYAETIRGEKLTLSRAAALEALKTLGSTPISPVYGVVTTNHEEGSAMIPKVMKEAIKAAEGTGAKAVKVDGWEGWQYSLEALVGELDQTEAVGKGVAEAIKGRSVYHLFRQDGNALIVCICEKPEESRIPGSAEESVLGTPKMSFYDSALSHKLICAAYAEPQLLNAVAKSSNESIDMMFGFVSTVFRALAHEHKEKSLVFGTAGRSVNTVAGYLKSFSYDKQTKPFSLGIWQRRSGASYASLSMDACGASYAPGTLQLSRMAASDKTIFYTETTPYTPAPGGKFVDMITPIVNIYNGYDSSLATASGMGEQLASRVNSVTTALKSVSKSLGKNSAVVVFDVKGTPSLTYYNTVTNSKTLASGGGMLSSSIGPIIGGDRNTLRQYYKVKSGKTTTVVNFTPPAEWGLGSVKPNIISTGKKIAIGTSAALNQLVLKNSTGKVPFTGAVYTVRPASLAAPLSMAATVDPSGGMAVGLAGAALGAMGEIHAVDTIANGVRSINVMVKAPKGSAGNAPVARPMPGGMARPMPAPGASDDDDSEDDEEEEEEESEEEEEESDDDEEF